MGKNYTSSRIKSVDLEIARLNIPGHSSDFFFGHNPTIADGVFEDVWAGSTNYPWPESAAKVAVSSSNAADTSAGLGCRSVELHGLSATGADQSEVITLNGTTEVESTLDYIRVSLMHNEDVGTYGGSHQGDITCRVTSAGAKTGDILSVMTGAEGAVDSGVQYGYGESQNGFTSIPLGKICYITGIEVIPNSSKPIDIILYEREGILLTSAPFLPRRAIWTAVDVDVPITKPFKTHIKIKPLTDLWFRVEGNGQSSGVEVWLDYYFNDVNADGL